MKQEGDMQLHGVAVGDVITVHFKDKDTMAGDFLRGRLISTSDDELVMRFGNAGTRVHVPTADVKYVESYDRTIGGNRA